MVGPRVTHLLAMQVLASSSTIGKEFFARISIANIIFPSTYLRANLMRDIVQDRHI